MIRVLPVGEKGKQVFIDYKKCDLEQLRDSLSYGLHQCSVAQLSEFTSRLAIVRFTAMGGNTRDQTQRALATLSLD